MQKNQIDSIAAEITDRVNAAYKGGQRDAYDRAMEACRKFGALSDTMMHHLLTELQLLKEAAR